MKNFAENEEEEWSISELNPKVTNILAQQSRNTKIYAKKFLVTAKMYCHE